MPPNPWGKKGQPAHQRRILQIESRLNQHGWQTVSGGSLPEQKFGNRFPDLVMQKGQKTIAIQVGKTTKHGRPVIRERRAINDLKATAQFEHVFFLRY